MPKQIVCFTYHFNSRVQRRGLVINNSVVEQHLGPWMETYKGHYTYRAGVERMLVIRSDDHNTLLQLKKSLEQVFKAIDRRFPYIVQANWDGIKLERV